MDIKKNKSLHKNTGFKAGKMTRLQAFKMN